MRSGRGKPLPYGPAWGTLQGGGLPPPLWRKPYIN